MDTNYKDIANTAAQYAKQSNINLDYSEKSIEQVESILGNYYEHLDEYAGEEGKETLWNIAVHFGVYLGETMLNTGLSEKGYRWNTDEGMPVLKNDANTQISPVAKAHKRILNGPEDSVTFFYTVAFSIANGDFPPNRVHRVINIELASGQCVENALHSDIDSFVSLIEKGREDFIILKSHDGYLQFYGIDNQFIMEVRVNLENNDFHTYSIINKDKEFLVERIPFATPYGEFTPMEQEVISLELVHTVIRKYYENIDEAALLKEIPYIDTTENMKRCMGLIK